MKKITAGMAVLTAVLVVVSCLLYRAGEFGKPAFASNCFRSDIQEQCCPMACRVQKEKGRDKANQALKNCMATVLECSSSEVNSADMFSRCDCD